MSCAQLYLEQDALAKPALPMYTYTQREWPRVLLQVISNGWVKPSPLASHTAPFPFHLPLNQQVYNPLIPSYKRGLLCQGTSGPFCHSCRWETSPARVYGYHASCSELAADGCVAHLTESRPSKDKGGGSTCPKHGKGVEGRTRDLQLLT